MLLSQGVAIDHAALIMIDGMIVSHLQPSSYNKYPKYVNLKSVKLYFISFIDQIYLLQQL